MIKIAIARIIVLAILTIPSRSTERCGCVVANSEITLWPTSQERRTQIASGGSFALYRMQLPWLQGVVRGGRIKLYSARLLTSSTLAPMSALITPYNFGPRSRLLWLRALYVLRATGRPPTLSPHMANRRFPPWRSGALQMQPIVKKC